MLGAVLPGQNGIVSVALDQSEHVQVLSPCLTSQIVWSLELLVTKEAMSTNALSPTTMFMYS